LLLLTVIAIAALQLRMIASSPHGIAPVTCTVSFGTTSSPGRAVAAGFEHFEFTQAGWLQPDCYLSCGGW